MQPSLMLSIFFKNSIYVQFLQTFSLQQLLVMWLYSCQVIMQCRMKKIQDLLIMENCPRFMDAVKSTETRTPEYT